ncbi:hypothetical protein JTB14_013309 [Gonioctena quinquepunctata]|nr:hypothetical protein JTB14_013309 [Gonioctena quinquepunctata]
MNRKLKYSARYVKIARRTGCMRFTNESDGEIGTGWKVKTLDKPLREAEILQYFVETSNWFLFEKDDSVLTLSDMFSKLSLLPYLPSLSSNQLVACYIRIWGIFVPLYFLVRGFIIGFMLDSTTALPVVFGSPGSWTLRNVLFNDGPLDLDGILSTFYQEFPCALVPLIFVCALFWCWA